jgi:hypothetical protein
LALAGDPRRLLIGAETVVVDLLVHPAGWRVVDLAAWSPGR